MADAIETEINLSDVQAWVDRIWAEPSPENMQILVTAMQTTVRTLSAARGEVIPSWWSLPGGRPDELEPLLETWDDRANQLWFRIGAYQARIADMLAGQITGEFTAYVVVPVLQGHAYASPDREAWSKVHFADVLEPFRLWNELGAFLGGTSAIAFFEREAKAIVSAFGETIRDEAETLAGTAAAKMRDEAEDLLSRADEIASKRREELSGTITAAIVGGALVLGLGALWLTRRVRRGRK